MQRHRCCNQIQNKCFMRIAILAPALPVRLGLAAMLSEAAGSPNAPQVVFQAASPADLLEAAPFDVLLTTSPAGLDAGWLDHSDAHPAVLLLVNQDPEYSAAALAALARLPLRGWGLLPLDTGPGELWAAIHAVYEGLAVAPPGILARAAVQRTLPPDEEVTPTLTEREAQVLGLLAQGLANKQIALALGISEHTVKFHISAVYQKLGVANRAEAVRRAVQQGLVYL